MGYERVHIGSGRAEKEFLPIINVQKKHGLHRAFSFGMSLRGFSSLLCSPLLNIQNLGNVLQ